MTFADRLREEIEYTGMAQKEVAFKAGVKKRALDMYLGSRASMPPADVAVKLAKVLNVTVEYLVTGEREDDATAHSPVAPIGKQNAVILPKSKPIRPKIERDLEKISDPTRQFLETAVHLFAEYEKHRT